MTKKELKELGLEAFKNIMADSEGINLKTVKYIDAVKDEEWGTYHNALIIWTCPELENFDGDDYYDFLEEHCINITDEIDGVSFAL